MLSTMFLTLEAAADLLQPTFMFYIVDRGIKNADVDQILHYGLIMLCIAAVGAAVRFAFGQTRRRLPPISIRKMALAIVERTNSKQIKWAPLEKIAAPAPC